MTSVPACRTLRTDANSLSSRHGISLRQVSAAQFLVDAGNDVTAAAADNDCGTSDVGAGPCCCCCAGAEAVTWSNIL